MSMCWDWGIGGLGSSVRFVFSMVYVFFYLLFISENMGSFLVKFIIRVMVGVMILVNSLKVFRFILFSFGMETMGDWLMLFGYREIWGLVGVVDFF